VPGAEEPLRLNQPGPQCISFPVTSGRGTTVEIPTLDVTGAKSLVMYFRADSKSKGPQRLAIRITDAVTAHPIFSDNFDIRPGGTQRVIVPLTGQSQIAIHWTASSKKPASHSPQMTCLCPIALT
jgi:hypothetical protein